MRRARLRPSSAVVATAALILLAAPGQAAAEAPPACWDKRSVVREGTYRTFMLRCDRTDAVRVVRAPAHGSVGSVSVSPTHMRFSFGLWTGTPDRDAFVVELSGLGGVVQKTVEVEVVPADRNTAPVCRPDWRRWRWPGLAPVDTAFPHRCQDAEQDAITIEGDGPGTFSDLPWRISAGTADNASAPLSYRTAIASGTETPRIWATDEFGARSEPAPVALSFGPGVDLPPRCWMNREVLGARPGVPRRFRLHCIDDDGDPIDVRIAEPPVEGTLALEPHGPPLLTGTWRSQSYVATYASPATFSGEDAFALVAHGPAGDGPPSRFVVRSQPPSANGSLQCLPDGYVEMVRDQPAPVRISCQDDEGDPLTAHVVAPPRQGRISTPTTTPDASGGQEIRFTWSPDPVWERRAEAVTVRVQDGYGAVQDVVQELRPALISWSPLPMPPLPPLASAPAVTPTVAVPAAKAPAAQARAALGTGDVRLLRRLGAARVYVPAAAMGRGLVARSRLRPMAIACPVACSVRAEASLRGSRPRREVASVPAGRVRALGLRLNAAERRAIHRAGGDAARFRLTVTPAGGRAVVGRMAVRLRP